MILRRTCLLALLSLLAGCATPQPAPYRLTIAHLNDVHSHLDPEPVTLPLRGADGVRRPVTLSHGGFARAAAAIAAIRAAEPNVLALHAGDALTGDLYFNLNDGRADAALMNTVCFDAMTLGNHEFDHGDGGLKRFLDALGEGPCHTPVLSANARFGPASPLNPAVAPGAVRPAVVLTRGGRRIGVIGLTVAAKTQYASRPDPGTTFADEAASAQAQIDRLRAQGVDRIVLLSHLGYQREQALAGRVNGVDVIVGGDSHTLLGPATLADYGLTPDGPYPTEVSDARGRRVCVVQAWQYAYMVGELTVDFDAAGDVLHCGGQPWLLLGDDLRRDGKPVGDADRAAMLADLAPSDALRVIAPDARAEAVLAPYRAARLHFGDQVVALATRNLCLRRVPGRRLDPSRSTLGDACDRQPRVIAHGGDVQQRVAEAFLQQGRRFGGADVALVNGGGVRVDLPQGEVRVRDVYALLPFRNTLVRLTLRGDELQAALEDALDPIVDPAQRSSGGYPYAAGLRWHVDPNQPRGQRFSQLEIARDGQWQPLEPATQYRLIVSDFLADGGDRYATLATIRGERRLDLGLDYAEAFLRYLADQPGTPPRLTPPDEDGFSTRRFVDLQPSPEEPRQP
ncbi:multifunctional 2',3'-cyclic-nucleotide 2'-phosphodiesterase/5'-nucleotidase/3'-nucleotidase [Chitiniphilus shinanonensis]|uniref:Multifunctional 2',3'-cyclic-nucleotide 2'-phosphodiesterase/5'-nucleotidase/3'-nucleotidase n=1 Tax=Chitiniphilus shinanonensis TaxID=553088 RepID=A0ABQ6BUX4_9NEIS|nr:5'-nucleotidase C-terminal domain-containing protein [Chitiniphilus shinanonensis]GLS05541.1 multifunctional 2',3'-cyclic-nucleotide 2'-phosphodiesterase/5'-nucleotidase/3'-nucleotidase [Chitiniphilus shinanonensis]